MKRPSILLYFSEGVRSIVERFSSAKFRKKYVPEKEGDGRPILVIPGFLGNDKNTKPLRDFLERLNYTAYPWELQRNMGKAEDLEKLMAKVIAISEKHQEKITIIGWSLGGVYARDLAKQRPDLIRQVITMGSPFGGIMNPNNAVWLFRLLRGKATKIWDEKWLQKIHEPAPVLTTAIYSKTDGVIYWKDCLEKVEDALHHNVEANGSHLGMPHNKAILKIIANELAEDKEP